MTAAIHMGDPDIAIFSHLCSSLNKLATWRKMAFKVKSCNMLPKSSYFFISFYEKIHDSIDNTIVIIFVDSSIPAATTLILQTLISAISIEYAKYLLKTAKDKINASE